MAPEPYQLVIRSGPNTGQTFELAKDEMIVGRDLSADIVINDAEVSRKHCRLTAAEGGYQIEDMGSTNGTFVDGQRLIGPHMLRPGEIIYLGENVSLVYESLGFDPDATRVSTPRPAYESPELPAQEIYVPPMQQTVQPSAPIGPPSYSGQVPPGPPAYAEPYYEEEEQVDGSRRTMIYVGCGCLIVLLCVLIGGAIAFDSLNLYCTPPFDALFPCY